MKHKRIITIAVTLIMTLLFTVVVAANSRTKTIRYEYGDVDLTGYIAFTNGALWLEDKISFWGGLSGQDTELLQHGTRSYAYITFGTNTDVYDTYVLYDDLDNNSSTKSHWINNTTVGCGTKGKCGKMIMWFETGGTVSGYTQVCSECSDCLNCIDCDADCH